MKKTYAVIFVFLLSLTFWNSFWDFSELKRVKSFDWILDLKDWETIQTKAEIIDIDVLDTEKEVVQKLKKQWKIVIWYINIWSIETYRDDFKDFPQSIVWKVYPWWEDERFLDIKNYNKFKKLIIKRLDIAHEKWFDGIEPDNMDSYDNLEETGFKISQEDMKSYLLWFIWEAHKRGMFVVQKNAPELSESLQKFFDWALLEGAFYNNYFSDFSNYIDKEKPVFVVEYTDNSKPQYFLKEVCTQSQKLWFTTILKNRNLDSFIVKCPKNKITKHKGTLEDRIWKKLDTFFSKLETKYLPEKRKKIVENIIIKIEAYRGNKAISQNKKTILTIIQKRFLIQKHIYDSKKLLPIKDKIYFWAFQEFGWWETEVSLKKLNDFDTLVSKKPAWAYFSQDFAEEGIIFPKKSVETIIAHWETPFIRLMPSMVYEKEKQSYNLSAISSWKFDREFIQWAQEVKKIKEPLFIDFAVEMNGNWFFYSGNPELYRQAYRHIIDIFRAEWVRNITWFFHPNFQTVPYKIWNMPKDYYPWDSYIDWIGVSLYWTQNPKEENIDFWEVLEEFHEDILEISKNKPFILLEFWVADFNPHYKKSIWLENTFKQILSNPYIKFSAISSWSEKWEEQDYYSDLRINSSKESLKVYNKYLEKDIFTNNLEFSN